MNRPQLPICLDPMIWYCEPAFLHTITFENIGDEEYDEDLDDHLDDDDEAVQSFYANSSVRDSRIREQKAYPVNLHSGEKDCSYKVIHESVIRFISQLQSAGFSYTSEDIMITNIDPMEGIEGLYLYIKDPAIEQENKENHLLYEENLKAFNKWLDDERKKGPSKAALKLDKLNAQIFTLLEEKNILQSQINEERRGR